MNLFLYKYVNVQPSDAYSSLYRNGADIYLETKCTKLPFAGQAFNKASTENGKGFATADPTGASVAPDWSM